MGFDYLYDGLYGINHFRHFLTTGVFGLSFYTVMVIVAFIHTGRDLPTNPWIDVGVWLIVIATLLRSLIPFFIEHANLLYLGSALLWGAAFLLYLKLSYRVLTTPRADGLPG